MSEDGGYPDLSPIFPPAHPAVRPESRHMSPTGLTEDQHGIPIRIQAPNLSVARRPFGSSIQPGSVERTPSNLAKRRRILAGQRCDLLQNGWLCCERRKCVHVFDKDMVQSRRSAFLCMNYFQRKTALLSMLQADGFFHLDGTRICQMFLTKVFSFSNSLIAAVKQLPHARASSSAVPVQREGTSDCAKYRVLAFLNRLANSCGDRMPDCDEIHLPYHLKADVFQMFVREAEQYSQGQPSRKVCDAYFYSIWKTYASHIKVRKVHRFTKCSDCEFYRSELAKAGLNKDAAMVFKRAKAAHVEFVQHERMEYARKRDQAVRNPAKFCSFIIDGADQSAYGLPHLVFNTKAMRGEKLKVRLIGVKEHLLVPNVFFYLMTEEFETGANHVIEAVHRFLSHKAEQGTLPPTLYVQADNCSRENKNRYFMSYFEMLIASGVVKDVYVSFLPVGHTHEDIDQVFSRSSVHLRSHSAVTLSDLAEELAVSFTPRPRVTRLSAIANFSGLCEDSQCVYSPPPWTNYHYFRFCRGTDRPRTSTEKISTMLFVRYESTHDWVPFHNGRGFLKFCPDLRRTPETHIFPPPNYEAVLRCLRTSETLINSATKMNSLHSLADEVYAERSLPCHWNLRSTFELNGHYCSESDSDDSVDDALRGQDDAVQFQYSYERGEMVAARPSDSDDLFWVAKIEDVHCNSAGVAIRLTVRWYEPSGRKCKSPYECSYRPAVLSSGSASSRQQAPWVDTISVSTVLVSFQTLTRKRKIDFYTCRKIRDSMKT